MIGLDYVIIDYNNISGSSDPAKKPIEKWRDKMNTIQNTLIDYDQMEDYSYHRIIEIRDNFGENHLFTNLVDLLRYACNMPESPYDYFINKLAFDYLSKILDWFIYEIEFHPDNHHPKMINRYTGEILFDGQTGWINPLLTQIAYNNGMI